MQLSLNEKITVIALLLLNTSLTVAAEPLGAIELTITRYYWVLLLITAAIISTLLLMRKSQDPIEVVGVVYDRDENKLELTIKNKTDQSYDIKSAVRLVRTPEMLQALGEDGIPMARGTAHTSRPLYDLLCEDDAPLPINPLEERTITYDVIIPQDYVNMNPEHNVEVHIEFGEPGKALQETPQSSNPMFEPQSITPSMGETLPESTGEPVETQVSFQAQEEVSKTLGPKLPFIEDKILDLEFRPPFQMKLSHWEVIAEPILLSELIDCIKTAPEDSIAFHLNHGNDFADWIDLALEDHALAEKIRSVKTEDLDNARNEIVKILEGKTQELPKPQATPVDHAFLLKTNEGNIISEITLLCDLHESIKYAPLSSIAFHLRGENDFANWVEYAVGDKPLADKLRAITYDSILEARQKLLKVLDLELGK
ncbi:MAG TPA: hypothetical protein ENN13_00075 [Candidatus Altiarchaeales archaeon]|nr:hypothetical protein [Candidatus Altiarchaeales archaeon]